MFNLLCHRVKLLPFLTKTQLGFLHITSCPIKSFSSSSSSTQYEGQSFTVSYLMETCEFSLENAISASQKLHLKTPNKPDSVIKLLSNHGFSNTQISRFVKSRPRLLLADPKKTLLPKFQFFNSIGISSIVIANIISTYPHALTYSLTSHIIPLCDFLKIFVYTDDKVAIVLKNCPMILKENPEKHLAPNIAMLIDHGVPRSSIMMFLMRNAGSLRLTCDKFEKCVKKVLEKRFRPSSSVFIVALQMIGKTTESTWNRKLMIFKKLGWSETEWQVAFRINPLIMSLSEKKIAGVVKFLVNVMGLKIGAIARNPSVLCHSLEKRIIPRCSVVKILVSTGLIKRDLSLSSYVFPTETVFLNKFVIKYEDYAPQVRQVYLGELKTLG